jgi:hypothetical protein
MKWIGLAVGLSLISGSTAGAYLASTRGMGLGGPTEEKISIRQGSNRGRRHGGGFYFLYFSGRRRHYGGGLHGGK